MFAPAERSSSSSIGGAPAASPQTASCSKRWGAHAVLPRAGAGAERVPRAALPINQYRESLLTLLDHEKMPCASEMCARQRNKCKQKRGVQCVCGRIWGGWYMARRLGGMPLSADLRRPPNQSNALTPAAATPVTAAAAAATLLTTATAAARCCSPPPPRSPPPRPAPRRRPPPPRARARGRAAAARRAARSARARRAPV